MDDKPKKKDARFGGMIEREILDAANKKASGENRSLAQVIRSFLRLYASDEIPDGFPPPLPEDARVRPKGRPKGSKNKTKK